MLRIAIFSGLLLTALPAASQEYRGGTKTDYQEIQQFHDAAVAKNNTDNVTGAVQDYLPRLRMLPTESPTIKGRDALEASWSATREGPNKPMLISEIVEMEVNGNEVGDWAYMICNYAYVAVDRKTGAVVTDFKDGRYLALLEKTEAGWKVLLDIDNGAAGAAPDLIEQLQLRVGK